MVYTLTKADMAEFDEENKKNGYTFKLSDMPLTTRRQAAAYQAPPRGGYPAFSNYARAVDNTALINPINAALGLGRGVARGVGAPGVAQQLGDISPWQTTPGISETAGNITGWMLPATGVAKGLEVGGDALKMLRPLAAGAEKDVSALRGFLGKGAQGAAIGVGTGALSSPTGSREGGAVGGGIGGALGGAVSGIGKAIGGPLLRTAAFENAKKAFLSGASKVSASRAQKNVLNDIVDHYNRAQKQASRLYSPIWKNLQAKGAALTPEDLPTLKAEISRDNAHSVRPLIKINKLQKVEAPEGGVLKSPQLGGRPTPIPFDLPSPQAKLFFKDSFDPKSFHFDKSDMGEQMRKAQSRGTISDKVRTEAYQDAMTKDFNDFLDNHGEKENYQTAQLNWQKTVLPFLENKVFKNHIKPAMSDDIQQKLALPAKGMTVADIETIKDTAPITNIANKLLPGGDEATPSSLNNLTTLLGGNQQKALQHTRDLLFSKHYDDANDTFDMAGLDKTLGKLKDQNKNLILTPDEQAHLAKMKELGKLKVHPWMKRALAGIATAGLIHPFLGGTGSALGGAAAALAEPYTERAIGGALKSAPFRRLAASGGVTRRIPLPVKVGGAIGSQIGGQ